VFSVSRYEAAVGDTAASMSVLALPPSASFSR
jgi:hypothetical protein